MEYLTYENAKRFLPVLIVVGVVGVFITSDTIGSISGIFGTETEPVLYDGSNLSKSANSGGLIGKTVEKVGQGLGKAFNKVKGFFQGLFGKK